MKTIGSVLKRLLLALGGSASDNYYNDITLVDKIAELAENGQISSDVLQGGGTEPLDVYPVGSIYMSVDSTSPASLFGGTWEQIKDRFLLSAGDTYSAGNTGGSATMAHTHNHEHTHVLNDNGWAQISLWSQGGSYVRYREKTGATSHNTTYRGGLSSSGSETRASTYGACLAGKTGNTSGATTGAASNDDNMPPYLTVYVWKRIADPV